MSKIEERMTPEDTIRAGQLIERHKIQLGFSISKDDLNLITKYFNLRTKEKLSNEAAIQKIASEKGINPEFIESEIRRITADILTTEIYSEI
jgi:hypothetical protein